MSADSRQRIDEAAGDWFARRESGEWTPADQGRLDQWLKESPLHRVAYLRIEHAWERAERLKVLRTADGTVPPPGQYVLSPFFSQSSFSPLSSALRRRGDALGVRSAEERGEGRIAPRWPRPRRKLAWGLAAGLAAALALTSAWLIWPQAPVYRTPVGGLETVPLADGSMVTLNTDSAIRVAVTAKERRVTLERGEAFFEVAKDPARPFIVQVGDKRIVAVGTQFSVWRDPSDHDLKVVVTEGTVRLESGSGTAEPSSPVSRTRGGGDALGVGAAKTAGATLLHAGTVAHAGDSGVLLQQESAAQAEEALSWRQGELIFHDSTLADAIAEFNRYNARQVVIDDPAVAALKVAGNFRATNVEAFVRLLEKGYPVAVEQQDGEVVLKAR